LAGALAAVVLALVLPGVATAGEGGAPKMYGFTVSGTKGFKISVTAIPAPAEAAASDPAAEGSLGLFLQRGTSAFVTYAIPHAKVTPTTIEADLGSLGRIAVTRVHGDRKKTFKNCRGEKQQLWQDRFEGTIEFHGEEGFTDVAATSAPGGALQYCSYFESSGGAFVPGKGLSGAILAANSGVSKKSSVAFTAEQKRAGAKVSLIAAMTEFQGEMEIQRGVTAWAAPDSLSFGPRHLESATVRPPSPFSGWGRFVRRPGSAGDEVGRWTGNLSVDFPGHADVPVTGPGFRATLERDWL
jgi:hypothetical protein